MPRFIPGSMHFNLMKIPDLFWYRLEPRSRSDDLSRSIQVRIRDPLWMLARQKQVGEFKCEDAGSAIKTDFQVERSSLTRLRLGSQADGAAVTSYNADTDGPLEMIVEREKVEIDKRAGVQIGQQFVRELKALSDDSDKVGAVVKVFLDACRINRPSGLESPGSHHDVTTNFLRTVAGRAIDGKKLFDMTELPYGEPVLPPPVWMYPLDEPQKELALSALRSLKEWYIALYDEPKNEAEPPWKDDAFEYEFAVSAPWAGNSQKVLVANEYNGAVLDWYSFSERLSNSPRLGSLDEFFVGENLAFTQESSISTIPNRIKFRGQPNQRWHQFEDSITDFGDMKLDITDVGKLLVMEFALIHGNDWHSVPVPLDLKNGSLCRVLNLKVTDVFGVTTDVERAGSADDSPWKGWEMFTLSNDGGAGASGDYLFLPPTLGKSEELVAEQVDFIRDDMANMIWGVEKTIMNDLGQPVSGYEEYLKIKRREEELEGDIGLPSNPRARYVLETTVPDNWIPYLPAHTDSSMRSIRHMRAEMVRDMLGIEAKSRILKKAGSKHSINEETVTRAATSVKLTAQRTRWSNGTTPLWTGHKTGTGRGKGLSGLRFDILDEGRNEDS